MGLSLRPVSSRLSRAFSTRTTVIEITDAATTNTSTRTSTAGLEIPKPIRKPISKLTPIPQSRTSPQRPRIPKRKPPIYSLPLELFQLVASFLDNQSAAAFCLSSRYICYAIGRESLSAYLSAPTTKHERRRNIEILERAFPSAWYCSWCDIFHEVNKTQHPRGYKILKIKNCGVWNGYLHDGDDFVIAHHHVRLAVHRVQWGNEYGIRLKEFDFEKQAEIKLLKTKVPTSLRCEANVVDGRFYLHGVYTATIPFALTQDKRTFRQLFHQIPQIIRGHVYSSKGHEELAKTFHAALLTGKEFLTTDKCADCATDFIVTCTKTPTSNVKNPLVTMGVEVWRDLGTGRSPFDTAWRAHTEIGKSKPGNGTDKLRVSNIPAGEIREKFERGVQIGYGTPAETKFVSKCEVPSQAEISFCPIWTQEIIRARSDRDSFNERLEVASRRRSLRYSR